MRFAAGINHTSSKPAIVSIRPKPNPEFAPEVQIELAGFSVWLSEPEATRLGQQLIEAGIAIRSAASTPEEENHDRTA